jgi:hypothetical protein
MFEFDKSHYLNLAEKVQLNTITLEIIRDILIEENFVSYDSFYDLIRDKINITPLDDKTRENLQKHLQIQR